MLVVGGGPVAAGKLRALVNAGARITVVAPDVVAEIAALAGRASRSRSSAGRSVESDLDGVWYVVAAAPPEVNRAVAQAAEARMLFVNAVDDLENASAYPGAIVQRAGVTIALSTDGEAPALAGLMREALELCCPTISTSGWRSRNTSGASGWRSPRADGRAPSAAPRRRSTFVRRQGGGSQVDMNAPRHAVSSRWWARVPAIPIC